ncbi:pyrophosphatase, MutT/nudix family domain protein [Burkholderia pseudomallei MSHR3458]|nr:pyrophosphatase, MutT/nudix family domain protein [Burkholderia pseudomallei MSHR2243]AIV71055.1 pyrophosphatase, MutT/NUDIX family domain protein [Burkholderia pseudomallei MSHR62]KGU70291.1 pyrophosphatase, MutT/NUDIX family domain protein [Burkholderia pseudomallei MSHR465J]KGW69798.1 pyrophosphatase, MutT/nudix family domain protein [Burkholderia pseudomallei MSHR3458]KGX30842.1 pyrophosphatase, MutT/nudix family domain protein [Burkholderia pseudomallei MSHR3709]
MDLDTRPSPHPPIRPFAHSPIRPFAWRTTHGTRRTAHGARPTTHGAAACLRSAGEPRPIAFPHPRHATRPDRRAVPSRGACRARRRRHPASDSPRAFFFSARQYGHIHSEQSLT